MIDFLGVGFQKCGTSSLAASLRRDSSFFMPNEKELHYFCDHNKKIVGNLDLYLECFRESNENQLLGEVTPCYITKEKSVQNMYQHNPALKILVSVRNPVDRFTSAYVHARQIGVIPKSMTPEFIIEQESRLFGYPWISNMVSQGFYSRYIKRLFSYFPENQVMINNLDVLVSDAESISKVIKFLHPDNSSSENSSSPNLAKFPHRNEHTLERQTKYKVKRYNLSARELRTLKNEKNIADLSASELWIQVRSRVEPLLATKYIDSNRELEKIMGETLNW